MTSAQISVTYPREFWSEGAYRSKVKSPLEMVVSTVRAVGAEVEFAAALALKIADLGQPLYRKQEPTGYSNASEEWVNSSAQAARALLLTEASRQTRAAIAKDSDPRQVAGLILGSPDFQRR